MTKPDDKAGETLKDPARQDPGRNASRSKEDMTQLRAEAEQRKATQFDGNPNVQKALDGPLGPKDDTPWKLKKKD